MLRDASMRNTSPLLLWTQQPSSNNTNPIIIRQTIQMFQSCNLIAYQFQATSFRKFPHVQLQCALEISLLFPSEKKINQKHKNNLLQANKRLPKSMFSTKISSFPCCTIIEQQAPNKRKRNRQTTINKYVPVTRSKNNKKKLRQWCNGTQLLAATATPNQNRYSVKIHVQKQN